jgi:hypothetical protein
VPTYVLEVAPGPAYPGLFIALEGGEGAGKSTQAELLVRHLEVQGYAALRTREPGGTPVAEAVRAILLDIAHEGMSDRAEALLFAAARADHAERVIRPALMRGAKRAGSLVFFAPEQFTSSYGLVVDEWAAGGRPGASEVFRWLGWSRGVQGGSTGQVVVVVVWWCRFPALSCQRGE